MGWNGMRAAGCCDGVAEVRARVTTQKRGSYTDRGRGGAEEGSDSRDGSGWRGQDAEGHWQGGAAPWEFLGNGRPLGAQDATRRPWAPDAATSGPATRSLELGLPSDGGIFRASAGTAGTTSGSGLVYGYMGQLAWVVLARFTHAIPGRIQGTDRGGCLGPGAMNGASGLEGGVATSGDTWRLARSTDAGFTCCMSWINERTRSSLSLQLVTLESKTLPKYSTCYYTLGPGNRRRAWREPGCTRR